MAELKFYHCKLCGRVDYVAFDGAGNKKCCEQEMELLVANSTDGAGEKHVPVIARNGEKVVVKVSTVEHPMSEEHYITSVFIHHGNKVQQYILTPTDKPEAHFIVPENEDIIAYEYCNLHGLWKS